MKERFLRAIFEFAALIMCSPFFQRWVSVEAFHPLFGGDEGIALPVLSRDVRYYRVKIVYHRHMETLLFIQPDRTQSNFIFIPANDTRSGQALPSVLGAITEAGAVSRSTTG